MREGPWKKINQFSHKNGYAAEVKHMDGSSVDHNGTRSALLNSYSWLNAQKTDSDDYNSILRN